MIRFCTNRFVPNKENDECFAAAGSKRTISHTCIYFYVCLSISKYIHVCVFLLKSICVMCKNEFANGARPIVNKSIVASFNFITLLLDCAIVGGCFFFAS